MEKKQFIKAYRTEKEKLGRSLWICKPSDGSKGREIFVTEEEEEVLSTFPEAKEEEQEEEEKSDVEQGDSSSSASVGEASDIDKRQRRTGTVAWVVQKYIANPMLLIGQRKFDVRCWVLVDSSFRVYVHRQGVLRTTSVPFTTDRNQLKDEFVHLSNHCIQTKAKDYGKYEETNEMFFDEFRQFLKEYHGGNGALEGGVSLEIDVMPQIHRIVALTMHAARDQMEGVPGQSFGSFNLFGYDFMLDDNACVHLLEINSSPAVADALLEEITRDVVEVAVLPFFPDETTCMTAVVESSDCCSSTGFQRVHCEQWMTEMEKSRVWLPHDR